MSAAASTADLSPVVLSAARGELPAWARAGEKRRAHIGRVAALMREWAVSLGLQERDVARWTAAAWLHDALREAHPDELRPLVPEEFRHLPGKLLHGPAVAERLTGEADEEVLDAVRYHTLGSPRFGMLGRALYLADFLEPGRTFEPEWTASLRARMPRELDAVLAEVIRSRVNHIRGNGGTPHPETLAFHGEVTGEA